MYIINRNLRQIRFTEYKNFIIFSDATLLAFPSATASAVGDHTKVFFQNVSNRGPTVPGGSSAKKTPKSKRSTLVDSVELEEQQQCGD